MDSTVCFKFDRMAADCIHNCSICSYFADEQHELINHVIRRHQHDQNFIIHCCYTACGISFRNLKSFKSHVYRKHGYCEPAADAGFPFPLGVGSSQVDTESNSDCYSASEAAYILKLKARHRLSQSAVNDVCASTKELFRSKLNELRWSDNVIGMEDSYSETLFSGLETEYKQQNFFTQHFGLVRPRVQKLGTVIQHVVKGNKYRCIEKAVQGYYVPLKEQLQALLSMPEVQQCLDRQIGNMSEYVYDICESYYVRHHPLNCSHTSLKLCLYTDDFELVNPIGSHRKKHKLTAFYWTLLNIPAEHRSQLSSIQLLALAKTKDVRKYGLAPLLSDFMATLVELEHGIQFCLEGFGVKMYHGFLVCVLADTPAAQFIGGFKEGVGTAVSPRRTCDAKQSDLAQLHTSVNVQ